MTDFSKLAEYLDSFHRENPSYDLACYIKEKIATDLKDTSTVNNGDEEELEDNDVTMSTPEQQSSENMEGGIMDGAFKELDVLNQLEEEKEKIKLDPKQQNNQNTTTNESFADNVLNKKEASLFDILQAKLTR